ncbi:MAG: hypothetical protein IT355_03895 [Gemmatimonadaceae bacterium]|nr:hypothetical protein [Gemmatimonadaceae bacterium]
MVVAAGVGGCSAAASDEAPRDTAVARVVPPLPPLPPARDTAASIAELTRRAARIDQDTLTMPARTRPVDLGAGATGTLTAWRLGSEWRRLRLVSEGETFRNVDTYWRADGALLGARLESGRPGAKPQTDIVFFRDGAVYYWLAADGRKLNTDARSTVSEAEMLQRRLADILDVLADDDAATRAPPPP